MKLKNLFYASLLLLLCACSTDSTKEYNYDRAQSPWVFRSVLDETPRIVTLALNDNLWAAYNTNTCALYKVWKGFVNLDGAVYTTVHGPQPTTVGNAYFVNKHAQPWMVSLDGKTQNIQKTQYRGHRFVKGQAELNYELQLDNGDIIELSEKPEFTQKEGSNLSGFERIFSIKKSPKPYKVVLKTNISSVALEENVITDGKWEVSQKEVRKSKGIEALDLDGTLTLNDTKTALITWFVKKPLIENENKIEGAEDEEERPLGFRLIARNDCKSCHNTYRQTVGPSYIEIAQKYQNSPENVATLVNKVKNGGEGVWGTAAMSAHPDVEEASIKTMVEYIMSLDAEEEAKQVQLVQEGKAKDLVYEEAAPFKSDDMFIGVLFKYFKFDNTDTGKLNDMDFKQRSNFEGIIPKIDIPDSELNWAGVDFGIEITGYLDIPKDDNYKFKIISDDGSRLYINDKEVIDNDGWHGSLAKGGEIALKKGYHSFRIIYFQGLGGKNLRFQWQIPGELAFETVPETILLHHRTQQAPDANIQAPPLAAMIKIPGDGNPLTEVHPSYDLSQARPNTFLPKVGGIDFLSDGRMVVSTWDPSGAVYILDGHKGDDPEKITTKVIASGFAEPLGLKVVNDEIYILQKHELTKLIDHDGDEIMDEYRVLSNDWDVSANFHEFAFGLAEKDGWLYGNLAIGILPGGASAPNQPKQRGHTFRVNIKTGATEYITSGMRTPNGIGIGVDNEVFASDNQGDWLPASKIMHVKKGAWFGSRAVDFEGTAALAETKPMVWLPQGEIGNSPSNPLYLNDGIYKGQMIHGEVTNGGVKRVFVEKVNGNYQGCVFRFIQGLEAGVNRIQWGPDGALYAGGIGSTGDWGHTGKLWYGLQKLQYNEKSTFEMLAVRAKSNGVEIEFTEALQEGDAWDPNDFLVKQWYYEPTENYGGPKLDEQALKVLSANVSADRKKVFLELKGMKANHVVYLRLLDHWLSSNNNELWTTEAWYTMNAIPTTAGKVLEPPSPIAMNTLSAAEKAAGWELLFDGKSFNGWHNYNKKTIGSSWKIDNGAMMLDVVNRTDGSFHKHAIDGGDIITEGQYENYEFEIEWKIQACGNSGIMYNVAEIEGHCCPWMTGPEMQVLDNTCHPDARFEKHRAGDLYDLIKCKYETVKPAGEWNQARLVINKGQVQHWLNGHKLVEYELWTDEFKEMCKNSKWKDFKEMGTMKKGHIALQDHSDRVWYRNIKIREL